MKLYYIANARFPTEKAHGIQIAKMCEAFIDAGVDVELVIPRRKTSAESPKNFYGLRHDIPLCRLFVVDIYERRRVGFFFGSLSFMLSLLFYFLPKRMRGEQGTLYTTDMDQFSFALIPFLGMPYFSESHDAKRKDALHAFFFKRIQGVVAINAIIREKMIQAFDLPSQKVIICPNGVDLRVFSSLPDKSEARNKLGVPDDAKIILYVGKFYHWKGLEHFISAASKAPQGLMFYMVGGLKEELQKVTGIHEFPSRLRCLGHRDFKEIPLWYAVADVLVALGTKGNAYSYFHTSPMKLFEYMAARRPIAASRTPANEEIVSEKDVFFYEPDNGESLMRVIERILRDPDEARARTDAAYHKVTRHTWDERARRIKEFMETHHYA